MAKVLRKITSVNGRLFAVDKESVNGGGSVIAPAGEILFGNAGGDGVTSDSGFTYDDTAKHLFIGGPSLDVYSGDPVDFGKATLALGLTATDTSDPERNLCRANLTVNPAAGGAPSMCTIKADISVPAVNAQNIANVVGIIAEAVHNGSGEVTQLYGFSADVENDGLGTVRIGWGFDSGIYGAGFDTAYNYYAHDLGGVATNGYYFWADSRGVFRIKEDATFDAVGQAIPTLYNPQFTKYTPGAVDFERIVLSRWNGNAAEIGLEAGGTGTLRALRLLGASVAVPNLQPATSDGGALGTTALQFSDLFLASGAVINFANGDVTLTHSSDLLTLAGGNLNVGSQAVLPGDMQGWNGPGSVYIANNAAVANGLAVESYGKSGIGVLSYADSSGQQAVGLSVTAWRASADAVNGSYGVISGNYTTAATSGYKGYAFNAANGWDGAGAAGGASYSFADNIEVTGGAVLDEHYALWGRDLGAAGAITNAYYSWFDSRGVRRVKEDSSFNSVGQAIEALYNPQFTKYTPGAANFERVILGQWNGNVAEIGTEKGGTGTLRALRLIGTRVIAPALDSAIADGDVPVSAFSFYLNEAGNALTVKVKYAGGTVKTGTIALT